MIYNCEKCKKEVEVPLTINNIREFDITGYVKENHKCVKKEDNIHFDIEYQYQKYLQMVKITEEQMLPVQKIETRRAFYGGFGQLLALMRNEVSEYLEDEGIEIMQKMWDDIDIFWKEEANMQN